MYSEKLLHLGGIAWFAALIVVAAGILTSHALVVRWGGAVMALGIVLHLVNYARIISHRLRPRLQPLTAPPAPSK
jgi:hypothetical protein